MDLSPLAVEIEAKSDPDTDAVAIYAKGEEWEHFAKFTSGEWSCKLGEGHDVIGLKPEDFEGDLYGSIVKVLCRPKDIPPQTQEGLATE